jgi:hypothetical protein
MATSERQKQTNSTDEERYLGTPDIIYHLAHSSNQSTTWLLFSIDHRVVGSTPPKPTLTLKYAFFRINNTRISVFSADHIQIGDVRVDVKTIQ